MSMTLHRTAAVPVQPFASATVAVTRPDLPPLDEFLPLLEEIWASHRLTNDGPFHQRFEVELARFLGVPQVALFANATLALLAAQQALGLTGEVITTPFSFVATAHSLRWNGLEPVFVDIDPDSLNLDPAQVEAAITPRTSAILPVHVYGRPCETQRLEAIARRHGLKLLYDAAHAFGVCDAEGSLLRHGDASVLSFHATKVLNTFEGGALVCPDAGFKRRVDELKNFGFENELSVVATGINAKMNEFQAALGLLQLGRVDAVRERRARVDARYREGLCGVAGIECTPLPQVPRYNHAYFPIQVLPGYRLGREALVERLRTHGVLARRYFYPLISRFPMYRDLPSARPERLPVATRVAERILCLPIYPDLAADQVDRIVELIAEG